MIQTGDKKQLVQNQDMKRLDYGRGPVSERGIVIFTQRRFL
jgi:hypothetical protein